MIDFDARARATLHDEYAWDVATIAVITKAMRQLAVDVVNEFQKLEYEPGIYSKTDLAQAIRRKSAEILRPVNASASESREAGTSSPPSPFWGKGL